MTRRERDNANDAWIELAAIQRTNRIAWLIQAQSLRRAAVVLWGAFAQVMNQFIADHPEGGRPGIGISDVPVRGYVYPNASLYGPMMMLQAFAIENMLKAFRPEVEQPTHQLTKLAQAAGLALTDEETDLVVRLEQAVWAGRYTAPLKKDEQDAAPPPQIVEPKWLPQPFFWDARDHTGFLDLYARLWRIMAERDASVAQMEPLPGQVG